MLAGALIPVVGLAELYLIDALALCATVWAVYRLPALPPLGTTAAAAGRAGLRGIAEGFRYISLNQVLLLSFLADIIAMVFGMPRALFPQLAAQTYAPYGEGLALGLLFAAIPIGAVLGGLMSGTFSRARRHGLMVIAAVVAWGVAITGFGLSSNLWVGVAFLAAAGVADMVSMVFRGAILLSAVTDELRGRMQGVFTVVVAGVRALPTSSTGRRAPPWAPVRLSPVAGCWWSSRCWFWRRRCRRCGGTGGVRRAFFAPAAPTHSRHYSGAPPPNPRSSNAGGADNSDQPVRRLRTSAERDTGVWGRSPQGTGMGRGGGGEKKLCRAQPHRCQRWQCHAGYSPPSPARPEPQP